MFTNLASNDTQSCPEIPDTVHAALCSLPTRLHHLAAKEAHRPYFWHGLTLAPATMIHAYERRFDTDSRNDSTLDDLLRLRTVYARYVLVIRGAF